MKDINTKSETLIKNDLLVCSDWDFNKEREFLETLFVGRFNTFIIVFSLFMTTGFCNTLQPQNKHGRAAIFFLGALVLFLIWLTIDRAYIKLDNILYILHHHIDKHPAAILDKVLEQRGYKFRYRVTLLMGKIIPWVCILLLILSGILIYINLL